MSDWTEQITAFLRCGNEYHHSLAFFQTPERAGSFHHYAVLCRNFDDVMVARQDALTSKTEFAEDLVRHGPSGSVGVYLRSGMAFSYEFCVARPDHRPRASTSYPPGSPIHDQRLGVAARPHDYLTHLDQPRLARSPHPLHHHFASVSLAGGTPITGVSGWLGHHGIKTTYRITATWCPVPESGLVWQGTPAMTTTEPSGHSPEGARNLIHAILRILLHLKESSVYTF